MEPATRGGPSTIGTLVFILWGLIVWGLQLTSVYVGHTWFCALGSPTSATAILSAALTLLAIAAILPVLLAPAWSAAFAGLREDRQDDRHLMAAARIIAVLSFIAAIWTGATAIFVQACELSR